MRNGRIFVACVVVLAGCAKRPAAPPSTPVLQPSAAPAGRLVPAVVAGFEAGTGGWRIAPGAPEGTNLGIETGGASRDQKWLKVSPIHADAGGPVTVEVGAPLSVHNWARFGNTIFADVKLTPPAGKATASIVTKTSDGKEAAGAEMPVSGSGWSTISRTSDVPLNDVAAIAIRWKITGPWSGAAGLDNVRVGAAGGLVHAFSVVQGPFASHEDATTGLITLQAARISSFPIHTNGWYLVLGTFHTRPAAEKEAARFQTQGVKAHVQER